MRKIFITIVTLFLAIGLVSLEISQAQEDAATKVLKSGLVGAGTGAVAAGMTGGKAGKGALIGAGTGVIGSVLLDAITGTPAGQPSSEGDYETPQEDTTTKVLKDSIVGAGTGAIAAGVTGGKAGQGALIGAGTGIIGNVLLDAITKPKAQQRKSQVYQSAKEEPKTKTIRKYDEKGNLIYEEIVPVE